MKFRDAIDKIEGLRLICDITPVVSPMGRGAILDSEFITDSHRLEAEFHEVATVMSALSEPYFTPDLGRLERALMTARDISSSLNRLDEYAILDDVELFEVKALAFTAMEVRDILAGSPLKGLDSATPPDLNEVVTLLDPEHTGSRHFHIYSAYSADLARKRRKLENVQKEGHEESLAKVMAECIELEAGIRKDLAKSLRNRSRALHEALAALRRLDLLIAKARLAMESRLVRPEISSHEMSYTGLRYIPTEMKLTADGKTFQPVDIIIDEGVTVITGANMGGKTVTLKSVALAQAMAQFGYFVAADKATVAPVADILLSIGDAQSALTGLSSFGAEITRIDEIISRSMLAQKYLNLIDEPARSTNPEEGRAIVNALVELLGRLHSYSLVTTHYSGIEVGGRRYRVKGLREDAVPSRLSPRQLGDMMDYSLEPHDSSDVSRDALRIARMLCISPKFAQAIEYHLTL